MYQAIATQFNAGGSFMWVILGVLGVAVAVMLERFIYFYLFCRTNTKKLAGSVIAALHENRRGDLVDLVQKKRTPLFTLLQTAVERYLRGLGYDKVREGVEATAIREVPKISARTNYLSLFANIATLLGLLGTIAGLQVSFSSLASVDAAQKASMLASGIAQAMNTTAFGLIVAVPCMAVYTIFNNKQQNLLHEIDEAMVLVLNEMKDTEEAR